MDNSPVVPPVVYRYMSAEHGLDALQTGRWKVGRISELNDPSDCKPYFQGEEELGIESNDKSLGGKIRKSHEISLGLLCYSAVVDDPVLWSHYGDKHKGIAFGFKFSAKDELRKIRYSEDDARPIIPIFHPKGFLDNTELLKAGYSVKAQGFTFEQEWRQFIPFEDCEMKGSHHFNDVPVSKMVEVVLGARCTVEISDIGRLIRKMKKTMAFQDTLQVRKALISATKFTLAFEC